MKKQKYTLPTKITSVEDLIKLAHYFDNEYIKQVIEKEVWLGGGKGNEKQFVMFCKYTYTDAPYLMVFDKVLLHLSPKITFAEYREIEEELAHYDGNIEYGYYDDQTHYTYKTVRFDKLFNELKTRKII